MPNSIHPIRSTTGAFLLILCLGLLSGACGGEADQAGFGAEEQAAAIAKQLLNEDLEEKQRRNLVQENSDLAPEILEALTQNLEPDTKEEERRIPWIWRVTVDAGERNDAEELREILGISLPEQNEPLLNWQAVVLGGGIVNGISRQGEWPKTRIREILKTRDDLKTRWQQAIEQSYEMASNRDLPADWRYDALRLIAMDDPEKSVAELSSYLDPERDETLQMGAISGLSDIRHPQVPERLLSGTGYYSDRNLELALGALMRTDRRVEALLDALENGRLSADKLGDERLERLRNYETDSLRQRARQLFNGSG